MRQFNLTMTRAIAFAALAGTIFTFAIASTLFVIGYYIWDIFTQFK